MLQDNYEQVKKRALAVEKRLKVWMTGKVDEVHNHFEHWRLKEKHDLLRENFLVVTFPELSSWWSVLQWLGRSQMKVGDQGQVRRADAPLAWDGGVSDLGLKEQTQFIIHVGGSFLHLP